MQRIGSGIHVLSIGGGPSSGSRAGGRAAFRAQAFQPLYRRVEAGVQQAWMTSVGR